jgi:hypothetical protein
MDKEIREIVSGLEEMTACNDESLDRVHFTEALVKAMGVIADKLERIASTLEEQNK